MNKINCILIDDETSGRVVLNELLAKHCPDVNILAEAANIDSAYALIVEKQPDLIFLDIQMPGGDGFELLKKFSDINFDVVFVTSFDKYAINAIKFSALDYLLKPVDVADLVASIEKVQKRKAEKERPKEWVVNLLNNLDEAKTEKKIVIHHQDKVKLLKLSDIVCFEAESNYTHIYTNDNQRYTPARVLKDFEEFLEKYNNFIRINKKVIVNLDYVTAYSKSEPYMLFLKNGQEYEIGRRKKTEIMGRIR
ncbi:MAG TPA: LytTR family DNA-binding domain-containing protein [Bacteroidia bacterium]|jgi:two-component system LytT family response regulator|nr:LytTR family DNA-binding domain-containing protein [Bacteroidia bacterium]